jgi:hypothetical protein
VASESVEFIAHISRRHEGRSFTIPVAPNNGTSVLGDQLLDGASLTINACTSGEARVPRDKRNRTF